MILFGQSRTAQSLNNDVLLISSSQSNGVLKKVQNGWQIKVHRKILPVFLVLNWFLDLRLQEFSAPFSIFLDVVFDDFCS